MKRSHRHRRAAILAAALLANLSGCGSDAGGTYASPDAPALVLELRADGTLELSHEALPARTGTWEASGDRVTLRLENGLAERAALRDDGSLVTRTGRLLTRRPPSQPM